MSHSGFKAEDKATLVSFLIKRLGERDFSDIRDSISKHGSELGKSAEWMFAEYKSGSTNDFSPRLHGAEFIEYLISYFRNDIFSEPSVRKSIYRTASPLELDRLSEVLDEPDYMDRNRLIDQLESRRWRVGSGFAKHFIKVFSLPEIFAGVRGLPAPAELLEVQPFRPLPLLAEFQKPIFAEVSRLLTEGVGTRAMVSLPTGAGKTRSVVEGLLSWRAVNSRTHRKNIVWIAQSDELCEQAVSCFEEVWRDLGHRNQEIREPLVVNRFWGNRGLSTAADVVVASVQKLYTCISADSKKDDQDSLFFIKDKIKVVIIDEAHRSTSSSYAQVLNFFEIAAGVPSSVALLGLSATPYRVDSLGRKKLVALYDSNLVVPKLLGDDPVGWLREKGYLSQKELKVIVNEGDEYRIDSQAKYSKYYSEFNDLHPDLLSEIAGDWKRNKLIVAEIASLPSDSSVLVFSCSVEHAIALSLMLSNEGISSTAITGSMRSSVRREAIERFRSKEIQVLTNFGVLTTGFDSPAIDTIMIARPTTSEVLYEQMIGRGMRGPLFGGTQKCLVIDVTDNLQFEGQMASKRHEEEWTVKIFLG